MPLDKPILPQWRDFKKKGAPRGFVQKGPNGEDLVRWRKEIIRGVDVLFDISKAKEWPSQQRRLAISWNQTVPNSLKFNLVTQRYRRRLLLFIKIAIAQTSKKVFISELFPEMAMELQLALLKLKHWKLIKQVDDLQLERLCGCGGWHCSSFDVHGKSRKRGKKLPRGIFFWDVSKHLYTADIRLGTIRHIEILYQPEFRQRLVEAIRAIKVRRGIKLKPGSSDDLKFSGLIS